MSTRKETSPNFMPLGSSIDPEFNLPSCTVEDVDRALFNLFDKDLNLLFQQKKTTKKVPVIFATGERFAVLRRKQPLRDKAGAIILPLISIERTGIEQSPSKGSATNQTSPITIKKKLSPGDSTYQQILNKERLQNSDERANSSHELATRETKGGQGRGASPGTIATRRKAPNKKKNFSNGRLISDGLANNIYEIYTMDPPKYYVATYEVTVWAQYTQQMNNLLTAIMSSYHSYSQRTFRIETDKGYYFVAFFGASIGSDNNLTNIDLTKLIIKIMKSKLSKIGNRVKIKFVKDRPGHDLRYALNSSKIKKKLNWESKTKFINGIKKTFKWYLNSSDYYKSFPKKDIVKRLGTKW